MEDTKIEWAKHSHNFWHGCLKVSPGCKNCYAETLSARWGRQIWGPNHAIWVPSEKYLAQPYKWDKAAQKAGVKQKVFSNSMSDFFEQHPKLGELRKAAYEVIENTPNLIWLLLTKRADNIGDMIPASWHEAFPQNVWLGVSVESPAQLWRLDYLAALPAPVKFVSFEPLLEPIAEELEAFFNLRAAAGRETILNKPSWWIVGGESGPGARAMEQEWAEEIVGLAYGYPTVRPFVKQLGSVWAKKNKAQHSKGGDMSEWPIELRVREVPSV